MELRAPSFRATEEPHAGAHGRTTRALEGQYHFRAEAAQPLRKQRQAVQAGSAAVQVVSRPRPLQQILVPGSKRKAADASECLAVSAGRVKLTFPEGSFLSKKELEYKVPCADAGITNAEYYNEHFRSAVSTFVDNPHCDCGILAYGATGSGKTYTIQGARKAWPKPCEGLADEVAPEDGVMQRTLHQIFAASGEGSKYVVCLSAVEIYNEKLKDLLHTDSGMECELVQDGEHVRVRHKDKLHSALCEVQVSSVADAMHSIVAALLSRTTRATRKNHESSRSHMLVGISLCKPPLAASLRESVAREQPGILTRMATLWLGDLCGSEGFDLGAGGKQLAETRAINASLFAFNTCLNALHRNQTEALKQPVHIPVRDSLLTRILADMMHGYGRLVLSVHVSADENDAESTRRTLEFAQRVAQIRTAPEVKAAQTISAAAYNAEAASRGKRQRRNPAAGAGPSLRAGAVVPPPAPTGVPRGEHDMVLQQLAGLQRQLAQHKATAEEREEAAVAAATADLRDEVYNQCVAEAEVQINEHWQKQWDEEFPLEYQRGHDDATDELQQVVDARVAERVRAERAAMSQSMAAESRQLRTSRDALQLHVRRLAALLRGHRIPVPKMPLAVAPSYGGNAAPVAGMTPRAAPIPAANTKQAAGSTAGRSRRTHILPRAPDDEEGGEASGSAAAPHDAWPPSTEGAASGLQQHSAATPPAMLERKCEELQRFSEEALEGASKLSADLAEAHEQLQQERKCVAELTRSKEQLAFAGAQEQTQLTHQVRELQQELLHGVAHLLFNAELDRYKLASDLALARSQGKVDLEVTLEEQGWQHRQLACARYEHRADSPLTASQTSPSKAGPSAAPICSGSAAQHDDFVDDKSQYADENAGVPFGGVAADASESDAPAESDSDEEANPHELPVGAPGSNELTFAPANAPWLSASNGTSSDSDSICDSDSERLSESGAGTVPGPVHAAAQAPAVDFPDSAADSAGKGVGALDGADQSAELSEATDSLQHASTTGQQAHVSTRARASRQVPACSHLVDAVPQPAASTVVQNGLQQHVTRGAHAARSTAVGTRSGKQQTKGKVAHKLRTKAGLNTKTAKAMGGAKAMHAALQEAAGSNSRARQLRGRATSKTGTYASRTGETVMRQTRARAK